jgi:transcriptional regulator with XRE-family HTH domain
LRPGRSRKSRLRPKRAPAPTRNATIPGASEAALEASIGREVNGFRRRLDLTVAALSKLTGLSVGMLSKIENGLTSPSLATLQSLSRALNVPVTAFFRKFEEQREASWVRAGEGVRIDRRGSRAGHEYRLLGHTISRALSFEPYLITLTDTSEIFPIFQHAGIEFLFMLEGEVVYRHGDKTYRLKAGDSLLFNADAPHGPEELVKLPARFLSIMSAPRGDT